jgi:diguanylate cyclase (GGDEF)-like protein/PAS domain S-box-containing protein
MALAQAAPVVSPAGSAKNILVLYSYGHGGKGISLFDDALLATLVNGGINTNQLYFEYLDLERNRGDAQYAVGLQELLKRKYAAHRIDLVVTVQQPARNWLLNEGRTIAPGAAAIMVQAPVPSVVEVGQRRVVSVLSRFDIQGTLRQALALFPDTRRVVLIAGSSEEDTKIESTAEQVLAPWRSKLDVEKAGHVALEDLLQRVAHIPPQSILLFTQFNRDANGQSVTSSDVEHLLVQAANAPLFGLYDFNLRNGGVGGSVVSVQGLGEQTGRLALDILSGTLQLTQSVMSVDADVVSMFDWNQIKRWGGDPSQLAAGTIFVNREPQFLERYGRYVLGIVVLFLAQSGLLGALWWSRRRSRRVERSLKESEERYRTAFMVSPDAINITRVEDGCYLEVSDGFTRMVGWTRGEAVGRTSLQLGLWASPGDRKRLMDVLRRDGFYTNQEIDFVAKDGSIISGLMSAHLMMIQGEHCLLSVTRDITDRKKVENVLAHEKALLEAIFNSIPDGVVYANVNREIVRINPAFRAIFGFDVEHLAGRSAACFYAGRDEFELQGTIRFNAQAVDQLLPYEVKYRRRDGAIFPGETLGTAVRDGSGNMLGYIAVIRDITERKQAQDKLKLAANVFTHAREGIIISAPDGAILDVNATFTDITGYAREEVIGQSTRILNSGRQSQEFYQNMWRTLAEQGHWYGEVWNRRKNGEEYAQMITISAVRDEDGEVRNYVALFSDITVQKSHEQQLEHIAHFDALTSLPNRVRLADRMQQAMVQSVRRQKRLAVAYLDLDGFKSVNDRFGHHVGDQLLVAISNRMKQTLREGDTLARLGGDEFVAVLIDLDAAPDTIPMLGRLLNAAAQPIQIGEKCLQVTASVGVTYYPQARDLDADQLLRQADLAMYQAKVAGKNRYHEFDAMQDNSLRMQNEGLERLRQALDHGEFVLHYQPKVNMRSGHVIGAEALIRWQHPERGLLAPALFLPTMEGTPLAVAVGEWVIDTALTQIETWSAQGFTLPVSVNVGAYQLQQADFLDRLRALLVAHPAVSPSWLEFEILETSALEDVLQVSLLIEACAAMGVAFALDDFGTGYSSLTYLKRLRVRTLKIDQSFVRDMLDDADDLAILQGVIGLAAAFRRNVIAEGVETVEHGALLLSLGCEEAQGYGIARPMPPQDLPAWAATWQPDSGWLDLP